VKRIDLERHLRKHGCLFLPEGGNLSIWWDSPSMLAVSTLPSPGMAAKLSPMIADELKELMHAEPFQPVRIVMGNQQSFVVAHTDYLMLSPDRQSVVLYDEQGRFKIINTHQIRLVEPVNGPSSKTS